MSHIKIGMVLHGCTPTAPFNREGLLRSPEAMSELVTFCVDQQRLSLPHRLQMGVTENGVASGARLTMQSNDTSLNVETWGAENLAEVEMTFRNAPATKVQQSRKLLQRMAACLNPDYLKVGEEHCKDRLSPLLFVWGSLSRHAKTWRGGGTLPVAHTLVAQLTASRTHIRDGREQRGGGMSLRSR